jgi:hypothetical protein
MINPPAPAGLPEFISICDRNLSYGNGLEAEGVRRELGSFDWESSPAHVAVLRYYGRTVRMAELRAIVLTATFWIQKSRGIQLTKLSRNAKRSLPLLIKYIQAHYDQIVPTFSRISLCTSDKVDLPLLDADIHRELYLG